jgi:hypothetical protein
MRPPVQRVIVTVYSLPFQMSTPMETTMSLLEMDHNALRSATVENYMHRSGLTTRNRLIDMKTHSKQRTAE